MVRSTLSAFLLLIFSLPTFALAQNFKFAFKEQTIELRFNKNSYIVEFKDNAGLLNKLRSQHKNFLSSLNLKPTYEYFTVFNGMALNLSEEELQTVQKYPGVKKTYPDGMMEALGKKSEELEILLKDSVSLIGADKVHEELGVRGSGVRVAIIDTGIDYKHPYLGGGFGPGYKVIGGYDFVNKDNDPMDDNSHGTHVAGIVAAKAPAYTGVAPEALLLAYKVLDASGSGASSTVLAAIEKAVNDKVQIISMSLGGPGSPDDPVSTAVNRATELGVVVIVAAGNNGPLPESIGSPGVAREAITVGATDKNDVIAQFSSRGPIPGLDVVKPEVMAPGVKILSTVLNGGEASYNGTSMATPHVSGIVALMLQLNPSLKPGEIKQILMGSALDLGAGAFVQGAGRVRAFPAMVPAAYRLSHYSIHAGLFKNFDTEQTKKYLVAYENLEDLSHDISATVDLSKLPPGVEINVSPRRIAVNPGTKIDFEVEITVTPETVVPNDAPFTYSSALRLTIAGSSNNALVPIVLQRSKVLSVELQEFSPTTPLVILVGNKDSKKRFYKMYPSWEKVEIPIGNGISPYWLDAMFFSDGDGSRVLLYEDLYGESVSVDPREAVYQTSFQPKDENGNLISSLSWNPQYTFNFLDEGRAQIEYEDAELSDDFSELSIKGPRFNRATKGFQLFLTAVARASNNQRVYFYVFAGDPGFIAKDIVFENREAVVVPVKFNSQLDLSANDLQVYLYYAPHFPYANSQVGYYHSEILREMVFTPFLDQGNWAFSINKGYRNNGKLTEWVWQTPRMRVVDGKLEYLTRPNKVYEWRDLDSVWLGNGLPLPAMNIGFVDGIKPTLRFWSEADVTYGAPFVFSGANDTLIHLPISPKRATERKVKLFKDGVYQRDVLLYFTNKLWQEKENKPYGFFEELLENDEYTIDVSTPAYLVKDKRGEGSLLLTTAGVNNDSSPPKLLSIQRIRNGEFTEEFGGWGSKNEIRVAIEDPSPLSGVRLYQRSEGVGNWTQLEVKSFNNLEYVSIPKTNLNGMHDLKIVAEDQSGNSFEYILKPAFFVK